MPGIIARTARLITLSALLQVLSAACLYTGVWLVMELFGPERYSILVATVLLPAAFGLLTVLWYRGFRSNSNFQRPELALMIGSCLFVPLVFVLIAPVLLHQPYPGFGKAIQTLGAMYLLLPVSVVSIATFNGTLFGLALSFFSILMAGQRKRNRAFHMS